MFAARDRLIVALDVPNAAAALPLPDAVADHIGMFNIGPELFVAEGSAVATTPGKCHPGMEDCPRSEDPRRPEHDQGHFTLRRQTGIDSRGGGHRTGSGRFAPFLERMGRCQGTDQGVLTDPGRVLCQREMALEHDARGDPFGAEDGRDHPRFGLSAKYHRHTFEPVG